MHLLWKFAIARKTLLLILLGSAGYLAILLGVYGFAPRLAQIISRVSAGIIVGLFFMCVNFPLRHLRPSWNPLKSPRNIFSFFNTVCGVIVFGVSFIGSSGVLFGLPLFNSVGVVLFGGFLFGLFMAFAAAPETVKSTRPNYYLPALLFAVCVYVLVITNFFTEVFFIVTVAVRLISGNLFFDENNPDVQTLMPKLFVILLIEVVGVLPVLAALGQ